MILRCLLIVLGCPLVFGRDDYCPGRRSSIGACLAGLCPIGSECIRDFCCKVRRPKVVPIFGPTPPSTYFPETMPIIEETEEQIEFYGTMSTSTTGSSSTIETSPSTSSTSSPAMHCGFEHSVGACLNGLCPDGYKCSNGLCCVEEISLPPRPFPYRILTSSSTRHPMETEINLRTTSTSSTNEEYSTTTDELSSALGKVRESKCPLGEPIGECVSGLCPDDFTCISDSCCVLTPAVNCTDSLPGCPVYLCETRGYIEFMTKNCARTCQRCDKSRSRRNCRNNRTDCEEWSIQGFCNSTLYTDEQKRGFCAKACNLCLP